MKEEKDIRDFGSWSVPRGWGDITLGQFQEISKVFSEKESFDVRRVLHVLCGKSEDEVNALPVEFAEAILAQLSWMSIEPDFGEPSNKVAIDGEVYEVNTLERMKTGEFVVVDQIMKADDKDFPSILAVLCRRRGEEFDSRFEAEVYPDRVEMFRKAPVIPCMRVITFFFALWQLSEMSSQLSSQVAQAASLIRENIEASPSLGRFTRWCLRWRANRILRLLSSSRTT